MSKRFILIVAILFAMFAGMQTKAACPTPPDCPSDTWTTATKTFIRNGCLVTIKYCYRIACGTYYDLYLDEITYPTGCNPLGAGTMEELFADAEKILLYQNPWNIVIPPCPAQSDIIYRFYQGQCYYNCPVTDIMYVKWCNPDAICYEAFTACSSAGGPTGWTGMQKTVLSSGTFSACFERVADCECDGTAEEKVKDCITRPCSSW